MPNFKITLRVVSATACHLNIVIENSNLNFTLCSCTLKHKSPVLRFVLDSYFNDMLHISIPDT